MIKTNELKGIIVKNGFTQSIMAKRLGITPKAFYDKMARGVFKSNEIEEIINILKIENPIEIFFANPVTQKVTERK